MLCGLKKILMTLLCSVLLFMGILCIYYDTPDAGGDIATAAEIDGLSAQNSIASASNERFAIVMFPDGQDMRVVQLERSPFGAQYHAQTYQLPNDEIILESSGLFSFASFQYSNGNLTVQEPTTARPWRVIGAALVPFCNFAELSGQKTQQRRRYAAINNHPWYGPLKNSES